MSRLFFLLLAPAILILGCGREDQAEIDRDLILGYVNASNLQFEEDPSGLFFHIDQAGGMEKPELTDSVEMTYRGTLLNGSQFDATPSGQTRTFLLDDLIPAWKIGIPKFGRGGEGVLLVPSALGYGNRRVGPIPANSVLVFEIGVVDF